MRERWRRGFIALTAVVVALAIASAIFSAVKPAAAQSDALYTPSATPSPSPSPEPTFTLHAPTSTPVATATPSPISPCAYQPLQSKCGRYVVQAGETLGTIARKFGVTVEALLAANPDITDPKTIMAGQHIFIPPPGWEPSPGPSPSSSPS
jgi:LysM repeat protein